jgi:hypothetical protein
MPAADVPVHLVFIALVAITTACALAVLFLLGSTGEIAGLLIAGLLLFVPQLARWFHRSLNAHSRPSAGK